MLNLYFCQHSNKCANKKVQSSSYDKAAEKKLNSYYYVNICLQLAFSIYRQFICDYRNLRGINITEHAILFNSKATSTTRAQHADVCDTRNSISIYTSTHGQPEVDWFPLQSFLTTREVNAR